jgi:hypothetical protein
MIFLLLNIDFILLSIYKNIYKLIKYIIHKKRKNPNKSWEFFFFYLVSSVPPAFSITSLAIAEALSTVTVTLVVNSP